MGCFKVEPGASSTSERDLAVWPMGLESVLRGPRHCEGLVGASVTDGSYHGGAQSLGAAAGEAELLGAQLHR